MPVTIAHRGTVHESFDYCPGSYLKDHRASTLTEVVDHFPPPLGSRSDTRSEVVRWRPQRGAPAPFEARPNIDGCRAMTQMLVLV